MKLILLLIIGLLTAQVQAREWKSLKQCSVQTGKDSLAAGDWLRKDRRKNTHKWQVANRYNLLQSDGYKEYTTFGQKRDFYKWIDDTRFAQGHEVKWAGNAYIITKQLVYLDNVIVRAVIIHDRKFMDFVKGSNALILKNIYPDLQKVHERSKPLVGLPACDWDSLIIHKEQCDVLDTLYARQPKRVVRKFNRMAAGKGIYALVLRKELRMKGDIRDCKVRCAYGLRTMSIYYDDKHCRK